MRRGLALAIATGAGMLALAPAAPADHHFASISEVYPGSAANPSDEYVEIRMWSAGQNLFGSANLVLYNASGMAAGPIDLVNVGNGANQRTALAGTPSAETTFSVQMDAEYPIGVLATGGGGVCLTSDVGFGTIDCVAWGTANISGAGTPAQPPSDGSALHRSIVPGCNTLLESGDDTNDSLADFSSALPTPEPNSATPQTSSCPNTTITKKPRARTRDRTPRFEFSGGDGFLCSLDGSKAAQCDSGVFAPGKVSRGKHKFVVRATQSDGSVDGTPAKYSWKIVRR
jgi:hypothetical protein